ncbi:MAG: DUF3025 domain-containing protein [Duganella sp.]
MLAAIDWSRPWYDSVRDAASCLAGQGEHFRDAFSARATALGLCNHRGLPLSFVPQEALPDGTAYEEFIGASGGVPTRDNLHDFFNGLVWLSFPRIKVQLNALQAAQIARDGVGKSRGPARDGATIFDENAALLVVRTGAAGRALVEALAEHRWREAFIGRRASFGAAADAEVWIFGHALMEKLVAPRKAITAHTRVVWADDAFFASGHAARRAWIDATVAQELVQQGLSTAGFMPMQALGVPGWWPDQDDAFYADQKVFRAKRQSAVK